MSWSSWRLPVAALVFAIATGCASPIVPGAPAPQRAAGAPPAVAAPSATAGPVAAPVTAAPQRVRYGDLKLLADAGVYIAVNEGYFAEQGLDVELITFDSAANMVAPLATNQLEAGGGALSAGLYNALRSGVNVRIVADKGHSDPTPPGFPVSNFLVRKALVDSGQVRGVADLRGRRYATPAHGISPELDLVALLKEGGLTPKDVDVNLLGFPDLPAAFANDSVDFGHPPEPFATMILSQGTGVLLKRDYEVNPYHQVAVLLYSPDFSSSPLAVAFMVAYLKGTRLYNDAFLKGDAAAREKAIAAMIAHTPVKTRALYDQMALAGQDPDGQLYLQSLDQQQDYFLATGVQQARVDLAQFIDRQHAESAVRLLGGPYQR